MAEPFRNLSGQPYVRPVNLYSMLVGHGPDHVDGLTPDFQARLSALVAAAPPRIQPKLGIYSGYRSPERQRQLFLASDRSGKMVARPGRSFHEKGRAVDLAYDGKSLSRAPKDVVKWIHDNAAKFGLYFPMSYENWHIEPIGTRPGNLREKKAIEGLQRYLVSRGAEIDVDGKWGPKTEAAFAQFAGTPGPTALERTGLLGKEVPPPSLPPTGIGSDPDRNLSFSPSPSDLARQFGGQQPIAAPTTPVERGAMLPQPQAPVSDMARAYGGQQPIAAPIVPVTSAPLGPTPGMLAQQYAQYRPAPNLTPQQLAPVSSNELAARVAAAQAPSSSPSLTPSTIARFAAGAQPPPTTPRTTPQQISAVSPTSAINPATPKYGYADRAFPTQTPQAVPNYSPAPQAPSTPALSPATPRYSPVSTPAPQELRPVSDYQTISPATPKYETVKVVTYPTISPTEHVGGIGSDPDRNMTPKMTLAEQYAAYRPAPNLAPYKPEDVKKPEPVITYKKVPIPTVNDARKAGAVQAPLAQEAAIPSVPAPLVVDGADRTPKYFRPKYGLGWAGGMVGGALGGPLGKLAGKYAGQYLASKLSRTQLPTPENFAGYGMDAIQRIQNGMAGPSSYAQAINNANGYTTQWSNTGPGGASVQTTSTPGGTTYSTWQQYGPSPMTMVTYGTSPTSGTGNQSSSSTTGGYTTTTGNLY
jgi:hypothetical protein